MRTETQFICAVDACGGLGRAFSRGLEDKDCPVGVLRDIVRDAYEAHQKYLNAIDEFYSYAESCEDEGYTYA